MPGRLIAVLLFLASSAACKEAPGLLLVRVDASKNNMSIRCVHEFELEFRPVGETRFTGTSSGSWEGGEVQYGMKEREGTTVFYVLASGQWVADEIMKNREEKFPNDFIFDIPLKSVDESGTFEVTGYWRYNGVTTGTARNPMGELLTLPDRDNIYQMVVFRETGEICPGGPPDAEVEPEVTEEVEPPEDLVEDVEPIDETVVEEEDS